ncbi:zinc-binding dehydrogenase [Streptomyces solisilvae]|uniref:zinc-binding dehydrogenase n=1 Tax=Streptomyces malaysiensis TaxID=92644 RepID=UPI0036A3C48A
MVDRRSLELARKLGATHAVVRQDAAAVVAEATNGGADAVSEAVGRAKALESAWSLTRRGGRTVPVGLPDPSETMSVPVAAQVSERRTLRDAVS